MQTVRMMVEIDVEGGPVDRVAMLDRVFDAINRQRMNAGLTGDDEDDSYAVEVRAYLQDET